MGKSEDIIDELSQMVGLSDQVTQMGTDKVHSYVIRVEPNGLNGWKGTINRKGGSRKTPYGPDSLSEIMDGMTQHVISDCLKPGKE